MLADNDLNGAGQVAADACKQRWLEAGRRVALLMPERPAPISTTSSSIVWSAVMSGFSAEEFEPDPAVQPRRRGHHGERAPRQAERARWRRMPTAPGSSAGGPSAARRPCSGQDGAGRVSRPRRRCRNTLLPQTETDPVALLMQYPGLLRQRGRPRAALSGRAQPALRQPVRAAGWRDGQSAQGSLGRTASRVLPRWRTRTGRHCIQGGMSSGEGVIHAIRDPI